eukprot:13877422-Alexandrium_andersonii.AAC.1
MRSAGATLPPAAAVPWAPPPDSPTSEAMIASAYIWRPSAVESHGGGAQRHPMTRFEVPRLVAKRLFGSQTPPTA